MSDVLTSHVVAGGAAFSALVRTGREIRFTSLGARPNVSLLLFWAGDTTDRMNIPDTLKAQYSACVRPPMVLMSDRGIGLASVTQSSLDWHDALCGHGNSGHGSYAADGNGWQRSARAGLLSELTKHGRTESALHATVNLFSKVALDDTGRLGFVAGHATDGDQVTLRSETDLLMVLSTAPHPLDPLWSPAAVRVEVSVAPAVGTDDPSRLFRDESARALDAARAVFV